MIPKPLLVLASVLAGLSLLNLCTGLLLRAVSRHNLSIGNTIHLARMMPFSKWGFSYFSLPKCTISISRIGCIVVESMPKRSTGCF